MNTNEKNPFRNFYHLPSNTETFPIQQLRGSEKKAKIIIYLVGSNRKRLLQKDKQSTDNKQLLKE